MISMDNSWVKRGNVQTKVIEYKKMDFFGPFLTFNLIKTDKGNYAAIAISCYTENPSEYEGDFITLIRATKELFKEIGEYTLKTKLFDARINSEDTEKIIVEKLKELVLF